MTGRMREWVLAIGCIAIVAGLLSVGISAILDVRSRLARSLEEPSAPEQPGQPVQQVPVLQQAPPEDRPPPRGDASAPIAPDVPGGVGAKPVTPPFTWITSDDYPLEALRNNWQGRVTVGWTIDQSGKARDCVVLQSSGHDVLDQATCGIFLRRARYRPAQDAEGRPVATKTHQTISWKLPD